MPFEIERGEDIVEVTVSGTPTRWELLEAFRELQQEDPRKEMPEVWTLAENTVFPIEWHTPAADAVKKLCPSGMVGARSAVVACDRLQKAQIELYAQEARRLPFEIRCSRAVRMRLNG